MDAGLGPEYQENPNPRISGKPKPQTTKAAGRRQSSKDWMGSSRTVSTNLLEHCQRKETELSPLPSGILLENKDKSDNP